MALLGAQVSREANMLAYGDAFFVAAVIAFLSLAGLIVHVLFRFVRARLAEHQAQVVTSNP